MAPVDRDSLPDACMLLESSQDLCSPEKHAAAKPSSSTSLKWLTSRAPWPLVTPH